MRAVRAQARHANRPTDAVSLACRSCPCHGLPTSRAAPAQPRNTHPAHLSHHPPLSHLSDLPPLSHLPHLPHLSHLPHLPHLPHLSHPLAIQSSRGFHPVTEPAADPLVGKTIAQYDVVAKLGG